MNTTIRQAVALAIGACALNAAYAQNQEPADVTEEIRVTGSRIIQNTGMTTPTPVASLSVSELSDMAPASVVEGLTQLPQFYASATVTNFNSAANGFFTSPGGGSLNLRGIGSKRTLVLLDSRRVVSSTIYGGPENVVIDGMVDGDPVHHVVTRTNGCEIARYDLVQLVCGAMSTTRIRSFCTPPGW